MESVFFMELGANGIDRKPRGINQETPRGRRLGKMLSNAVEKDMGTEFS